MRQTGVGQQYYVPEGSRTRHGREWRTRVEDWFEGNVTRIENGNPIFVKIVGREKCGTLAEEAEQREKKQRRKRARGRDAGARGTP